MQLNSGMSGKNNAGPCINAINKRLDAIEERLSSFSSQLDTEVVNADVVNSNDVDSPVGNIDQLSSDGISSNTISSRSITTVELNAENASINKLTKDVEVDGNVKAKEVEVDKLKATDLELTNPNFDNLNVAGDSVLNKATAEEVVTKKLKLTEELELDDGITLNSFNSNNASIDNAVIETASIDSLTSTTMTSEAISAKDLNVSETADFNVLNANTVNASDSVTTQHIGTSDIDAGVYKRNDSFYINIDIEPGAKGIIKLPHFDGTGKFYFVDEDNESIISLTVINNKTDMQSTLVNYSQVGLYLTDINVGTDGHIYFGISDQPNIKKMYYTLDINNDFIEVPAQLPGVTTFDDIDIDYEYVPEFLNRVVILGSPSMDRVNSWGLDIQGVLKAASMVFPTILKVPELEVTGEALFRDNILVLGKIAGEFNNKLTFVVRNTETVDYDNTEPVVVDLIDKAYRDDEGNVIKDTYLTIEDAENDYVKKMQIGAASTDDYTGVCPLDENGQIPISYLPTDALVFKGLWNAETNTPTIADGTGSTGDFYICNVAGSQDLGHGLIEFSVNDTVIYDGTIWHRVASSSTRTELLNIIGNSSKTDTGLMTPEQFIKLDEIEEKAQVNVQSDWDETDDTKDAFIKNKPELEDVAITGEFKDLKTKPELESTLGKIKLKDESGWETECDIPALKVVALTLSQYQALSPKDPNTVYAITGE